MTSVIEISGLGKTFRKGWRGKPVEALVDVSMTVDAGEVFGYVGPNGAGKTTTIRILVGASQPTAGTVRLFGRDGSDHEARRGVGYVPENPLLYDHLTPAELVAMSQALHQRRVGPDERAYGMRWLERFDLAHVANRPIRGFSKGMLQRTALAQALAIRPRLLILDEPLSGLDPIGRRDVVEILSEYKHSGGTILLTSHVLHDVERLADRFGLINRGRLLTVQSPNDLVSGESFVTVRSLGNVPVAGFGTEAGGRWQAEVRREDLWPTLLALQAAGHTVIEIRPTLTLESAFFRYLQRTETSPAG
jgi:ABC-2 type transport system ATP-binding protein